MNVPLFPSQDLAKLVLGYLAEEQLMTAYDEFLQASPYLDALQNEYDRIFMTSLKSILAEYRAVKIYIETCKPYSLKRKLLCCPNLLEVVKFLVQNVDISKIQSQDVSRMSKDGRNTTENSFTCAVCTSLNLPSCACKSRISTSISKHSTNVAESSSMDATSLADLPGNHNTTRKKHVKVLLDDTKVTQSAPCYENNNDVSSGCSDSHSFDPGSTKNMHTGVNNNTNLVNSCVTPSPVPKLNEIRPVVTCNNRIIPHRVSAAGTFQDFSHGVRGAEKTVNTIVPDSSTLENIQTPITKETEMTGLKQDTIIPNNLKPVSKAHIYLTVGTIQNAVNTANNNPETNSHVVKPTGNVRTVPIRTDPKITILSDVKVDDFPADVSMPPVLKNTTSTPLMQMQTILINGRPAYRHLPQSVAGRTFTKDEIMAMPTIIVVTTSGSSQMSANVRPQTTTCQSTIPSVTTCGRSLEPLVIDVPSDTPSLTQTTMEPVNMTSEPQEKDTGMLVQTVDLKNASAPKEGAEVSNKNTPQVLPPLRKSSSTPRRSSHVRVLDFATPRRILQEAIAERTETTKTPVEVVISRSPNLHTLADPNEAEQDISKDISSDKVNKDDSSKSKDSGLVKENDKSVIPGTVKRANWDADLRALAIVNRKEDIPESRIQPRCRPKPKTAKKSRILATDNQENEKDGKKNMSSEKTPKRRNSKHKRKSEETVEESVIVVTETVSVPVKPTINIITGSDWISPQEPDKSHNKSIHNDPEDTPEMDRISLQNAIGVKLNISDLLETPYKQALYDIQMETPRFLGPDLPDEPLSDIKIMNIPTPRFLNTPKPTQATPNSYSSRPTDYSSGGSYYKPDDQDYMSIGDLGYPASTSKDNELTKSVNETPAAKDKPAKNKSSGGKPTRPVRSCAKNVSYYNSPLNQKTKDFDEKSEAASSCSETVNLNSSFEKHVKAKTPRSSVKKKVSAVKKRKTPVKKDKTFIKIKPRRVTPIKKRTIERSGRKRTISKDIIASDTPLVIPAPTKSRRKSSTPRKLHCTKNFDNEKFGHESPENISNTKQHVDNLSPAIQDSDTEQLPLRWSDDGTQDTKPQEDQSTSINESESIPTIKEYIASELRIAVAETNCVTNFHGNLIKRGFDAETAKIIERDLLDTPPDLKESFPKAKVVTETEHSKKDEIAETKTADLDTSSNLKIVQDDDEDNDEIEFSAAECNEDSENYLQCHHDDIKDSVSVGSIVKLKEKYSMEVCIDDDVMIRLRATPFTVLLDEDPQIIDAEETEMAVNSIANIDKLYTPLKESLRAQVYEIFDSTLTSLDTPLKATSPRRKECDTTVTEIVLEVEKLDDKERTEGFKRKRLHSDDSDTPIESKRAKPEAQYLLNSANIQNIDIETVLSKLHGP